VSIFTSSQYFLNLNTLTISFIRSIFAYISLAWVILVVFQAPNDLVTFLSLQVRYFLFQESDFLVDVPNLQLILAAYFDESYHQMKGGLQLAFVKLALILQL
jgi:hypothetical protein